MTWTTKFLTMLCSCPCLCPCSASIIKFTPEAKIFFLLEKICYRAGPKETFLIMETLSVKARAHSCKRKTISMNFKNATISLLWYYYQWEYCHSHSFLSAFQACTFILPLSVWIALIYFCHMISNLPAMVLTVDFGMVD